MKKPDGKKNNGSLPSVRRDKFFYSLLRFPGRLWLRLSWGFSTQTIRPKSKTYLLYSNHATNADPAMLGVAFSRHMYFVSSDHLQRFKNGRLIMWLAHPILRNKAKTETKTAMDIIRCLRQGHNVCICIEGERTYNGNTLPLAENAGHLAKLAGVGLITYRLHGGYFAQPRWSEKRRKGPTFGQLVREYSPDEIKAMTREEIQAAAAADLWLDAYAEQEKKPISFTGENLAHHLETALFLCPSCLRIGKLKSERDMFACDCGLSMRIDKFGFFHGESAEKFFRTVRDWYIWQEEKIEEIATTAAKNKQSSLLMDADQQISIFEGDKETQTITADIVVHYDALEILPKDGIAVSLPLAEIQKLSCTGQMTFSLIHEGRLFEFSSPFPRSGVKYQLVFQALKNYMDQEKNGGS